MAACKEDKSQDKFKPDQWDRSRSRRCLTCVASPSVTPGVKRPNPTTKKGSQKKAKHTGK